MPYKIEKVGEDDDIKFNIIDVESGNVVATRKSEEAAENKLDTLEIRDHLKEMGNRLPKPEMSAEDKAAAYDKLMKEKEDAEKNTPTPPTNQPPAPTPKTSDPEPPKKTGPKSRYWGDAL